MNLDSWPTELKQTVTTGAKAYITPVTYFEQ
jgi:hypothetical protein